MASLNRMLFLSAWPCQEVGSVTPSGVVGLAANQRVGAHWQALAGRHRVPEAVHFGYASTVERRWRLAAEGSTAVPIHYETKGPSRKRTSTAAPEDRVAEAVAEKTRDTEDEDPVARNYTTSETELAEDDGDHP